MIPENDEPEDLNFLVSVFGCFWSYRVYIRSRFSTLLFSQNHDRVAGVAVQLLYLSQSLMQIQENCCVIFELLKQGETVTKTALPATFLLELWQKSEQRTKGAPA